MTNAQQYKLSKKRISKKDVERYFSKLDLSKLKIADKGGLVLKRDILNVKQVETIANLRTETATTPLFIDKGGPLIKNVDLQLIFPGSYWGAVPYPHPTASTISTRAANIIQASQYMSELTQYRNIGKGGVFRSWPVLLDVNPPNPFTDDDVANIVAICIAQQIVPLPLGNILYIVIMPPGINSSSNFIGEHTYFVAPLGFPVPSLKVHFGWVTNDNTLEGITRILSHELVEAVTDPEGDGIVGAAGTCPPVVVTSSWCEIGDVRQNQYGNLGGGGNGVSVQAYWSQNAKACVIPGKAKMCSVLAYKGVEGDERMYYSYFDGNSWVEQQQVSTGLTSVGPALAVFNDRLYMAWKGVEGDERMYYSYFDGNSWVEQQQVVTGLTSTIPGTSYRLSLSEYYVT